MCPRWRVSKCKRFEWAALCVRSSDIDFRPASLTLCTRNARSICINCTYNARITFGKLFAGPAVLSADALAGKIFWLSRVRSTRVINTPRIISFIRGHYREPHAARQIARARTARVQFAHRPRDPFNLPEATIALTPIPTSLYLSGTALRVRSLSLSYSLSYPIHSLSLILPLFLSPWCTPHYAILNMCPEFKLSDIVRVYGSGFAECRFSTVVAQILSTSLHEERALARDIVAWYYRDSFRMSLDNR